MDVENKNTKWLKFAAGFLGWFLVSTLVFAVVQNDSFGALFIWLFYLAINLLVMVILAILKRTRWISLGIVSAMAFNFLIAMVMRPIYEAVCFVPVTNSAFQTRRVPQRVPQTVPQKVPTVVQNRQPVGFHDGESGTVNREHCVVFGWTFDPDDRKENIQVRVLVDGEEVAQDDAGLYRPDLTGSDGCTGGSCGYWFDLWNLVSHNEQHTIRVQAQDLQDEQWRDLSATPKTLKCSS